MSAREGEGPVARGVSALNIPDSVAVVRVGDEVVRPALPWKAIVFGQGASPRKCVCVTDPVELIEMSTYTLARRDLRKGKGLVSDV
jgi:hypothetical protein